MKRMIKYAAVASVAGALALGMAMPTQAAEGRNAAAAIGFGAGALVGAAAANAATYGPHGPGYAYGPAYGYADRPGYAGYSAYAYAPGGPAGFDSSCATDGSYGQGIDYSACNGAD
jgi:hypothetical protein